MVTIVVYIVAGHFPSDRGAAQPSPAPTGVKVFAYVPGLLATDGDVAKVVRPLIQTDVYGLSFKFGWRTVEPQDGTYQWSTVDSAIAAAAAAKKRAMIRVVAGSNSPDWIYSEVRSITFSNTDLANPRNHPATLRMPVPWDQTYLEKWDQFIAALGNRYDGNPTLYSVQMTGGGYIGEMNLPKAYAQWSTAGYSDQLLTTAWTRIIDSYRAAFPRTPTNLDIGEPLGAGRSHVMQPVLDYVTSKYPSKVYVQENGLNAGFARGVNTFRRAIEFAATNTVVGYQMYGGKGLLDAKTGDRLTCFRVAVEDHASYIEVYSSDVTDPTLASAFKFLSSIASPT